MLAWLTGSLRASKGAQRTCEGKYKESRPQRVVHFSHMRNILRFDTFCTTRFAYGFFQRQRCSSFRQEWRKREGLWVPKNNTEISCCSPMWTASWMRRSDVSSKICLPETRRLVSGSHRCVNLMLCSRPLTMRMAKRRPDSCRITLSA
jgi:hypothetical protein